jgi:hypothetical protein
VHINFLGFKCKNTNLDPTYGLSIKQLISNPFGSPSASPMLGRRSPSPRRGDFGFASAVSNLVDQAHSIAEMDRRKHYGNNISV